MSHTQSVATREVVHLTWCDWEDPCADVIGRLIGEVGISRSAESVVQHQISWESCLSHRTAKCLVVCIRFFSFGIFFFESFGDLRLEFEIDEGLFDEIFELDIEKWELISSMCHLLESEIRPRYRIHHLRVLLEESLDRLASTVGALVPSDHIDRDTEYPITLRCMKKIRSLRKSKIRRTSRATSATCSASGSRSTRSICDTSVRYASSE